MKTTSKKFIKLCNKAIEGLHPAIDCIGCDCFGPVLVLKRSEFLNPPPSPVPYRDDASHLEFVVRGLVNARLKEKGLYTSRGVSPIETCFFTEK